MIDLARQQANMLPDKFKSIATIHTELGLEYLISNGPKCLSFDGKANYHYGSCRIHCDCGCEDISSYQCYNEFIKHMRLEQRKKNYEEKST